MRKKSSLRVSELCGELVGGTILLSCPAVVSLPDTIESSVRKIAISDIHGCARSFRALLRRIDLQKDDRLFLLGDYTDRGPDSRGVLDLVFELIDEGYQVQCLAGNHDIGLLRAGKDPEFCEFWKESWGGANTLKSFGVEEVGEIPERYVEFLYELPWVLEVEDYILVHAGLDFYADDPLRPDTCMLEIRKWYSAIDYEWLGQRYIVHGHTPTPREVIEENLLGFDEWRVLDIDAGCVYVQYEGLGNLCAFDLDNRALWFQPNVDMSAPWR